MSPIHTGTCPASGPAERAAEAARRDYCLHDAHGRPLGRIEAPVNQPRLGTSAPTVYLKRD
ncbi:MAG: hypothetical protein ACREMJ_10140 [Gemmatimonadales bacterium]